MSNCLSLKNRYGIIFVLCAIYVAISLVTRLMLLAYEGDATLFEFAGIARIFSVGLLYDLASFSWVILPFVANALIWPDTERGRRGHKWVAGLMFCVLLSGLVFQVMAEFLFWNEFSSRFNFIAVDYLVYTREVVGNFWQSYPAWLLVSVMAAAAIVGIVSLAPVLLRIAGRESPCAGVRGDLAWVCRVAAGGLPRARRGPSPGHGQPGRAGVGLQWSLRAFPGLSEQQPRLPSVLCHDVGRAGRRYPDGRTLRGAFVAGSDRARHGVRAGRATGRQNRSQEYRPHLR